MIIAASDLHESNLLEEHKHFTIQILTACAYIQVPAIYRHMYNLNLPKFMKH